MSETAALPLTLSGTETSAVRIPRRPLKLGFACTLFLAGAYGILSDSQYVSSSNAIVSAYVLDLRTPIDGIVSGLPLAAGTFVQSGQVLAHLDNPLLDHQHLDNLRTLEEDAESNSDSLAVEQTSLTLQRDDLLRRAQSHTTAITDRFRLQTAAEQRLLDAAQIALHQVSIDLGRGRQLHEAGILSSADFDKLTSQQAIAAQQAAAQQQQLDVLLSEASAASHGLLTEPGTNSDVAYSRQRADELTYKLTETARSLDASRAQAREARIAVGSESSRAQQLTQTDLRSPVDGLLWKIDAINGERAATGDPVLSLIDCHRQFLLVEIPQERLPDIAVGRQAHLRLTGESAERTGTVLAVTGDPQRDDHRKLAAFPLQDSAEQLATVRIALDASNSSPSSACLVGRTARVLIPTQPTNSATRWFRQYF